MRAIRRRERAVVSLCLLSRMEQRAASQTVMDPARSSSFCCAFTSALPFLFFRFLSATLPSHSTVAPAMRARRYSNTGSRDR
jgi:hypothetical protein